MLMNLLQNIQDNNIQNYKFPFHYIENTYDIFNRYFYK